MAPHETLSIPQPTPNSFIGNLWDIDPTDAPASFDHLADMYGEIFQLDLVDRHTIVCSSCDTINDPCDACRFQKPINTTLEDVGALTGDGIFTTYPGEKVDLTKLQY